MSYLRSGTLFAAAAEHMAETLAMNSRLLSDCTGHFLAVARSAKCTCATPAGKHGADKC